MSEDESAVISCANCGSAHIHCLGEYDRQGFLISNDWEESESEYQCQDCGERWFEMPEGFWGDPDEYEVGDE